MSGLIADAQPVPMAYLEDIRLNPTDFRPIGILFDQSLQILGVENFSTEFWPGGIMDNDTRPVGLWGSWSTIDSVAGASSRFGFVGVTRDQYGSVLKSATVKLYRTSNDALLDTTTSDANTGAFLLNTAYYPDAHYIVAHKSGTPDVDGVTVNTLIAT